MESLRCFSLPFVYAASFRFSLAVYLRLVVVLMCRASCWGVSLAAGGGGHAAMPTSLFQFLGFLVGFDVKPREIIKLWPNLSGASVQTRRDAAGSSICLSETSQLINHENFVPKNYRKLSYL